MVDRGEFQVNALRVYSESVRYSNSKTRVKFIKYDFEQSVGSYNIVNYEQHELSQPENEFRI